MSEFIIADDHSDDEFGAAAAAAPAATSEAPIVLGAPAGDAPAPAPAGDDLFGGLSEEKPVHNEFDSSFGVSSPAAAADSGDFGFSFVSEDSPIRKWEKEHEEKLLAKSKEESEKHQKALAQAKEDTEQFFEERKQRCEAKKRQNAEEEEIRRENLKKILEEGDPWIQSAKLIDYQKTAGTKDSSRMRHVLISLKH